MRSYTNEERHWLDRFNEELRNKQRSGVMFDTMNQRWENYDYYDDNREFECFTEHMEDVVNSKNKVPMDRVATLASKPIERVIGSKANKYSPSDYYALPHSMYSHRYENAVIDMIDKDLAAERKLQTRDFPDFPGIIKKGCVYKVTSFFEGTSRFVGCFLDLEDAKKALREYNRTVTHRGYGVDYE